MKASIRSWNYEVFGKMDLGVEKAIKDLDVLDNVVENDI